MALIRYGNSRKVSEVDRDGERGDKKVERKAVWRMVLTGDSK